MPGRSHRKHGYAALATADARPDDSTQVNTESAQPTDKRVEAVVPQMLFSRNPVMQSYLKGSRDVKFPAYNAGGVAFTAGKSPEFKITGDGMIDPTRCCLMFNLDFKGTDTTHNQIASALDLIAELEVLYQGRTIEKVKRANIVANLLLWNEAHLEWFEGDGGTYLGFNNRYSTQNGVANSSSARTGSNVYIIPMAYLSGFFRSRNLLPLFGASMVVKVKLDTDLAVISKKGNTDNTYEVTDMQFLAKTIIVDDAYKDTLKAAMNSKESVRITFQTFDVQEQVCPKAKSMPFNLTFDSTNLVSMFILKEMTAGTGADQMDVDVLNKHVQLRESFPLADFESLDVTVGSREFTPASGGIKSYEELYRALEDCHQSFVDITGTGVISRAVFQEGYTQAANSTGGEYGCCVLGVNFEPLAIPDDKAMNNGITRDDCDQIRITLKLTSTLKNADPIIFILVSKSTLLFHEGAFDVDK